MKYKVFNFFLNEIKKKELSDLIIREIFIKILITRLKSVKNNFFSASKDLLNVIKPTKFLKVEKNLNFLEKIFFKKISLTHQLSFITNNGKLEPHTDSRNKLCSLMLYFPDNKNLSETERKKELDIGTQFWNSEIDNYENDSFEIFTNDFYNKSNRDIKTDFKGQTLYGFIKNHKSWHSVDEFNINPEYVRRSININLSYNL